MIQIDVAKIGGSLRRENQSNKLWRHAPPTPSAPNRNPTSPTGEKMWLQHWTPFGCPLDPQNPPPNHPPASTVSSMRATPWSELQRNLQHVERCAPPPRIQPNGMSNGKPACNCIMGAVQTQLEPLHHSNVETLALLHTIINKTVALITVFPEQA